MIHTVQYKHNYSLSYVEYGDKNGYPILVQHGLIASIKNGADLFKRLIELRTRVICIARPGYGASSAYEMKNMAEWGDIAAVLIAELELSQFDLLGISSGAPYSYSIGYKFPQQARKLFILSGTPALYDDKVLSYWPYPVNQHASLAEMQELAFELFFAHCSPQDLEKDDNKDAVMNHCFGVAQDLKLRCVDWGFGLADVKQSVIMRHSKSDDSVPFITAEITAKMLSNCRLEGRENEVHFSQDVLDDFIRTAMADHYFHSPQPRSRKKYRGRLR